MAFPQTAADAYAGLDPVLTSPDRAEAMVFARVTKRMETIFADPSASSTSRVSVLHDNRRLWQAAAAASADENNALPQDLRARIIGIAGFVDRHTSAVLRKEAPAAILIEINRRIVGGLSAKAT
ncbi:MAG: flagellar biosynthesis regulator FlaF [Pseudomonadota bacterium]